MDKKVITEVVSFDITDSISVEAFREIVHALEIEFHMKQAGYIDSELAKGRNASWTMIMHWESLNEAKLASKELMGSPLTERFRNAVIPSSVKMGFSEQIQKWNK